MEFHDVWRMARENGMTLILKSNGYALCDENLKTLVTVSSLRKAAWYINNIELLRGNLV